jgi:anaerobic selenocysteine-containing dehydrogenase
MILSGGNPANTNPNSKKVAEALSQLDLFVVRDMFLTETAKLAHYILPAASFLERTELHFYGHYQHISVSRKVLEIEGVKDEYSFWHDLSHRLGFGEKYFPWETEADVNRWLLEPTGISLEELEAHPEGFPYKPIRYQKYTEAPFPTPSGKVEFTSRYLENLGLSSLPVYQEPLYLRKGHKDYPYILITGARKAVYYHSRFRNIPRFRKLHPEPEAEFHPFDAEQLGLKDRDKVRITSEMGYIQVLVKIMPPHEIREGIIQVTHGWEGESNVNRLTFDEINDPISGFPQLTSVPVKVEKEQTHESERG